MLLPLIGARLHGWLDDLAALVYLGGAVLIPLRGVALGIALAGAAVHFLLTRLTNYPQGTFKVIPFRTHAFIELGEGIGVVVATWRFLPAHPPAASVFLILMGASQFGAFAFSSYGPA